jgi:hypothetical protein
MTRISGLSPRALNNPSGPFAPPNARPTPSGLLAIAPADTFVRAGPPSPPQPTAALPVHRKHHRNFFDRVGRAFKHFGDQVSRETKRAVGRTAIGLSSAVSAVGRLTGFEDAPRKLNPAERDLLQRAYGGELDLDKIRIVRADGPNTFSTDGGTPRTLGDTIYWPKSGPYASMMSKNGLVDSPEAEGALVHEAGHVSQYQHSGPGYITDSLRGQLGAVLSGGSRDDAYDWQAEALKGTPWSRLSAEQQAELMQDHWTGQGLVRNGVDLGSYAAEAVDEARAGRGWTAG